MRPRRDPLPTIEVDAQEYGFQKERKAFERERHADHSACQRHKLRPQQAQLEGEHCAGDRPHREENRGALGPSPGELQINRIARSPVAPLGTTMRTGIAIPMAAKMMWKASDMPICDRAARRSFIEGRALP